MALTEAIQMNEERKAHIIASLEADMRLDGRKKDEFRPITIELNASATAEGSAKIIAGDTEVIAGVKMGVGTPYSDSPDAGVLMVNAELLPLSNPEFETGPPSIVAIETARVIDRGIRESDSVDTKKLCIEKGEKVWMVQVDVVPINFDGNLIDIGGYAALAALLTAKYPKLDKDGKADYHAKSTKKFDLKRLPIPITVGKIGTHLIVDPTQEEEKALDARLTITMVDEKTLCSLQKGGDAPLTQDEIAQMVELAKQKSQELRKKLLEATK